MIEIVGNTVLRAVKGGSVTGLSLGAAVKFEAGGFCGKYARNIMNPKPGLVVVAEDGAAGIGIQLVAVPCVGEIVTL